MDCDEVAFADEVTDLLRGEYQLFVQLDDAAEQDEGVLAEFMHLWRLALALHFGDGQGVTTQLC